MSSTTVAATAATGVMICGHGSRDADAISEFASVADGIRERLPEYPTEHGFLEFARPVIRDGLEALRARGVRRILAVPGMLFAAGHAKNDIPSVLNAWAASHPDMEVLYGAELGLDLKMVRAGGERIRQALAADDAANGAVPAHETLLVTVGRGASDPDANSNVAKVNRMLQEGLGLGWGEVVYSGVTFPLVRPGLEHVVRLGFRRIVVFPWFLFTGVLVKRIYDHARQVADANPGTRFVLAPYLNDHPLVLDTFADRVRDIVAGTNAMNCQLCKYREQALGFEDEVGLRQESHHHHVEGVGSGPAAGGQTGGGPAGGDEGHDHDHGHSHGGAGGAGHHHHHHPYPHADHPLGPVTLETAAAAREKDGGK